MAYQESYDLSGTPAKNKAFADKLCPSLSFKLFDEEDPYLLLAFSSAHPNSYTRYMVLHKPCYVVKIFKTTIKKGCFTIWQLGAAQKCCMNPLYNVLAHGLFLCGLKRSLGHAKRQRPALWLRR